MQNKENKIDGLFRDKLYDHKVVPPPPVWNRINNTLDNKNRRRRIIWILGLSAAASLLFAFLAGWYFSGEISTRGLQEATNNNTVTKSTSPSNSGQTSVSNFTTNGSNVIKQVFASNSSSTNTKATLKLSSIIKSDSEYTPNNSSDNKILQFLFPIKTLVKNNQGNNDQLIAMNNSDFFTDADRSIIARNIYSQQIEEKQKTKRNSGFSVGVQASPVYRFENAGSQTQIYANINSTSSTPQYKTNVSGGIAVSYKTNKKLSFQSGVYYDEVSQNGGQIGVTFSGQNWISDSYTEKNFLSSAKTPSEESTTNNVILSSNMGVATITMPQGTEVATTNTTNKLANQAIFSYNFSQRAQYIQIPLIIRYRLIDQRLGLHLLGGINTDLLISNDASLSDNNKVVAKGETEGLNSLTFNSSLGLGLSYAISQHFDISLEPTMKFQLNSLSSQDSYNARPYALGIFTGITYQF
jgi:hypothetical protein